MPEVSCQGLAAVDEGQDVPVIMYQSSDELL
jgi:hypothetical protein